MAKLTLTPITSITNEESFVANYNQNLARTEAAVEEALFLNGTSPNSMAADLDMNSFRIINSPAPVDDNDLVRLIDVAEGIKGDQGEQGPPGNSVLSDSLGAVESAEPAAADKLFVWTGADTGAFQTITSAGLAILDDATPTIQRATLGLGNASLKNVGTTANTVAEGDDSRFSRYVINLQNGNYSFTATDTNVPTVVYHTSGSAHAYTISPATYTVGCQLVIYNGAAGGVITLTRGAGVSLYVNGGTSSANATIAAGGSCTAIQVEADKWFCSGAGVA